MILDLFANPISFIIWAFSLLIAVDIHEFAHAWIADRLGDPTPRAYGRLTLNPLAHLDPVGTLMLLLTRFGWGKPVPIDTYNLENPRRDSALISLAGPASNLILATILSVIGHWSLVIGHFLAPLIILNVSLAIFNLLPIPPLDGSKILLGLLPTNLAFEWETIFSQYGLLLIIFLVFPFFGRSLASIIILPIINLILDLLL
jgi:Zn-dependent protease